MKILYLCAMEKEAIKISQKLNMKKIDERIYKNESETMLITGIGKQITAINLTDFLCKNEKPDIVVNIGYAGSTDIEVGKWVNITKSYNYEWEIPGEQKYSMKDFGNQGLLLLENVQKAECYSAECFVTKTNIRKSVIFDMELHSIAIICDMYKIPLISLKKVSDNLSLEKYYENIDKEKVMELESCIDIINKYKKQK